MTSQQIVMMTNRCMFIKQLYESSIVERNPVNKRLLLNMAMGQCVQIFYTIDDYTGEYTYYIRTGIGSYYKIPNTICDKERERIIGIVNKL